VRLGGDRIATGADPGDDSPFLDDLSARDEDLAELQERDRVAIRRLDRDRPSPARHGAHEGDRAGGGREYAGAEHAADVDAPVLSAGVRIVAENEGAEDRAVGRPRPALRPRHEHERGHGRQKHSPHRSPPRSSCRTATDASGAWRSLPVLATESSRSRHEGVTRTPGRAGSGTRPSSGRPRRLPGGGRRRGRRAPRRPRRRPSRRAHRSRRRPSRA
jgi:hypothetical protein